MVYKKVTACTLFSLILIAAGVIGIVLIPKVIRKEVQAILHLETPTSPLYKSFQNTSKSTDVYMRYYLMNVTNPDEAANGTKAIVQEVGPYVYLEEKYKHEENIQWHPNGTVSYTYASNYVFQSHLSAGAESDMIYTVDMLMYGISNLLGKMMPGLNKIRKASGIESPFVHLTVNESLWGYKSPFAAAILKEYPDASSLIPQELSLQQKTDLSTADPAFPTAAWTGGSPADGLPKAPKNSLLRLTQWNGMSGRLDDYWGKSNFTNAINGTDGSNFWPGITTDDKPYVFVDTFARSVQLEALDSTTLDGIELHRFVLQKDNLESMHENPDNKDFDITTTGFLPRPKIGEKPRQPVFISKPHYLDCNTSEVKIELRDAGKTPKSVREAYDTFLNVEPMTGQVFQVYKRVQLNAFLENYPVKNTFTSTKPVLMFPDFIPSWYPLFWVEQTAEAPSSTLDTFKKDVLTPLRASRDGGIAACVLGGVLLIATVVFLIKWMRTREYEDAHPDLMRKSEYYEEGGGSMYEANLQQQTP